MGRLSPGAGVVSKWGGGVAGFLGMSLLGGGLSCPGAGTLPVPNASFEAPATLFVSTLVSDWQKLPKPGWYEETGEFLWSQLSGVFLNPAEGRPDRILNCHERQAVWLFAVPEVGLLQELGEAGPSASVQTRYEPGRVYELTAGVLGGGGSMLEGATLELDLYYRDDATNLVVIAATTVTNVAGLFGNPKVLLDYSVPTPVVAVDDPWAGRAIGIRFVSTVSFELQGGYWDLDNVRLTALPSRPLTLRNPRVADGHFTVSVEGDPGGNVELLATSDPGLPAADWLRVGFVEDFGGEATLTVPLTPGSMACFLARRSE
jgi:hypothetical protein